MPDSGFDISNKVALITGGTSGLGRAIALGFAEAGARVFAGSHDQNKIDATFDALMAYGDTHEDVVLDVAEPESIASAFSHVQRTAGRLDILVNAAGITHRATAEEMALEDWNRVLNTNLTGTFLCCQAGFHAMKETGGAIINIASLASFRGWPLVASYGPSKAAGAARTQTLAAERGP